MYVNVKNQDLLRKRKRNTNIKIKSNSHNLKFEME